MSDDARPGLEGMPRAEFAFPGPLRDRLVRLADVDLSHAIDEGEGHRTVRAWRADHEAFWHSGECRRALGDPAVTVDDDTPVVLERFRLLDRP